jgi:hyaluronan synthase
MLNEKFWGRQCISGEDKRLTYLVQGNGYKTAYQDNVEVTTFCETSLLNLLKQKIRWTRNSWRADLRALTQRWLWRRPVLAFYLLEKSISAFTILVSPIVFGIALYTGNLILAGSIIIWWMISRFLKSLPYLQKNPRDLWMVPLFVVLGFVLGLLKIYALMTMNRQGWLTRQASTRTVPAAQSRVVATLAPYLGTGGAVVILFLSVLGYLRVMAG